MTILAFDTSAQSISLALGSENNCIDSIHEKAEGQHASRLLPFIDNLLKRNNLDLNAIDLFAVSNGPGSFTGIRIALSTAMGLAYGLNKKIYTASSLAILAASIDAPHNSLVLPLIDARGKRLYSAIYKDGLSLIEEKPRPLKDIFSLIENNYPTDKNLYFVGDGSVIFSEFLEEMKATVSSRKTNWKRFHFAAADKNQINAEVLLKMAAKAKPDELLAAHQVQANYGIESSAKRNLRRAKKDAK